MIGDVPLAHFPLEISCFEYFARISHEIWDFSPQVQTQVICIEDFAQISGGGGQCRYPVHSMHETQQKTDLRQLASDVLNRALRAGATDAEAVVYQGDEFSARVRLGQVETLKESGSRAVGLRV